MAVGSAVTRRFVPRSRRSGVAALLLTLVVGVSGAAGGAASRADTRPVPGTPVTVSADALPTWQVNGVVWSQVVVGNTVYATGSFSKARPPGVPEGGPGEVSAENIFAYDIRTGNRVTRFRHRLNAPGLAVTASPDRKRVYVAGDFTRVDGRPHGHVAAFATSTDTLVTTFRPSANGRVQALAVSRSSVYLGGAFSRVNGRVRERLAALGSGGGVQGWRPSADRSISTMVLTPNGRNLVVGGTFSRLGGADAYGMGSLSVTTGQPRPWAANATIRNATRTGAITSLRTDGKQIYGSGYAYGPGSSFEGTFAANPYSGRISWLDDCHGDTYDVLPVGSALYSVGHAHDCSAIGEFPETTPRTSHRLLASATVPTGVNQGPDSYGWNYAGWPAAGHLVWFPELTPGSYTGQSQAAWSLAGNYRYLAVGGEFPKVNGVPQQGLVRFARPYLAPNAQGPSGAGFALAAASSAPGAVTVSWTSQTDPDNETLTYQVFRDGSARPFATLTGRSTPWQRPALSVQDAGVPPGSHTYRVQARDPFGNLADSATATVTVPEPAS